MDRRNFVTAAAGSVTAWAIIRPDSADAATEAANAAAPTTVAPPEDLDAYVATLDEGMARIARWSFPHPERVNGRGIADVDLLARDALQSMYITGMLGDLPLQLQVDERMQRRVEQAFPTMDRAVEDMTSYLSTRTDDELQHAADVLRRPGAVERLVHDLDRQAGLASVSGARRRQLREMTETVAWRLAHQPPSLLINEFLDKADRASRTDLAHEARIRDHAARLGEAYFWDKVDKSPRKARLHTGAKTFGIGVVVLGLSAAALAAGAFPFVFGMTVGVIVMLIGLIIMLTSLALPNTLTDSAAVVR